MKKSSRNKWNGLLGLAVLSLSSPAFAGFEFTPSLPPVAESVSAPSMSSAPVDQPMPISPPIPVTAEPLGMPAPAQAPPPVYIRREHSVDRITPPPGQPMDTQALLKATQKMRPLNVAPAAVARPQPDGRLVINPYPLQTSSGNAAQQDNLGNLSVEQAMMEQGGMLRPVAAPGQSGETERARISARYDSTKQYLQRDAIVPRAPVPAPGVNGNNNITPMPGGEGSPLHILKPRYSRAISNLPDAPSFVPASPVDFMQPQQQMDTGFPPAVGFGRDLPLPLALSQVIPPDYSYAFGNNVNTGASVSWEGGKPWDQVLNDMLAPAGMKAVISSNQVMIQAANS